MKLLLIPALLSLSTLAFAHSDHEHDLAPKITEAQCGKTELADVMGEMKKSMKAIKAAGKAQDSKKITMIAEQLLTSVQKAQIHVPLSIATGNKLTTEQQTKFEDFQKGIQVLEQAVAELVAADSSAAQKSALGKISKISKKGHKAFKMDCDD